MSTEEALEQARTLAADVRAKADLLASAMTAAHRAGLQCWVDLKEVRDASPATVVASTKVSFAL